MEIDRNTLALVLAAAKRDGGDNSAERFAIRDAAQAVDADHLASFPVDELPAAQRDAEQLTLFDVSDYEA